MAQGIRFRTQATMDLTGSTSSNRRLIEKIQKGYLLREMFLRLSGSLTYAAAGNNIASTLNRGDEWGLLQNLQVVANGSDVIRSFSGHELRALNRAWFGSFPRMSSTLGDGVTAAPTFDSSLIIPFWQPNSSYPMDTILDTRQLGDLRLEVTTAAALDINSANGPTATAATLEIGTYESYGVEIEATDWVVSPIRQTAAGANSRFTIDLSVTAAYRGWLINIADGANPTSSDLTTAVTKVKVKSGTTVFFEMSWAMFRDVIRQRRGITRELVQSVAATNAITGAYLNAAKSTRYNEDAWLWLDFVQDGYMKELIDSMGLSELQLEFEVASACTITLYQQQLYPRRK
jgi:hypothetical protein